MTAEVGRHRLACGAVVLTRASDANDIVAVRAFAPMGPLYEADDEAGISSLVQDVLPRGTERRTAAELQEALAALGAELDAGAGSDLGSVSLRSTAATWEPALELFLETVTRPAFRAVEVETEVAQTLGALAAREDQLLTRAMDLFRERFYGSHPLHKPAIGYRATVAGFDRDRVVAAAERLYRPVPAVVAAVGRFDEARLVERIDAAFGADRLDAPLARPAPPEPRGGADRLELDREAAYLVYGFPAPDLGDPDYAAARVVDAVLGGSMSSRLFIELREKRSLAYQVATLYDDKLEGSLVAGYIVTDPGRAEESARGLAREFRRVVDEPIDDAEIDAARSYLRGAYLLGAETNLAQASRIGRYEAYGLGQDFGDRWLAAIEDVDAAAARAAAERWFTVEPTRAWVVPTGTPAIDV